MLIKKLIQRLLDSRTTPSEAAHNASSIYTEPTWFNGTPTVGDSWTDNLYTGTAPSDGYLNVSGSANINTANAGSMIQAKISGAQISQATPMTGQGFNMMAPISKGATFSVNGIHLANITVRFFKSIGGGYNRFVRRALPCLRPSFNYLPKVFLRAKRSGYLSGRSNWLTPRQSLKYQRQTHGRPSQCRLTVGQLLKAQTILQRRLTATSLKGNTKCSVFASVVSPIALQQFLFRAKKAKPSALPFTQTVRTFPLEHLKHFRLANLETGGALC